jgi:2-polyprenyl-3-methyl-5-hydroxy-6-metoxy-1,4-benzoquinol methylase
MYVKKNYFGKNYKGLDIRSDSRVHDEIMRLLLDRMSYGIEVLDIAAGKGALSKRICDTYPDSVVDCNDLDQSLMLQDARDIYNKDLNQDFIFEKKYDLILAVEIIEHLENPFHFIANLKRNLKSDGVIIITTPNVDSILDRVWYFIHGHAFYFGKEGILNSGGHITMCPFWLLEHISNRLSLKIKIIKNNIFCIDLLGFKGYFVLTSLNYLNNLVNFFKNPGLISSSSLVIELSHS